MKWVLVDIVGALGSGTTQPFLPLWLHRLKSTLFCLSQFGLGFTTQPKQLWQIQWRQAWSFRKIHCCHVMRLWVTMKPTLHKELELKDRERRREQVIAMSNIQVPGSCHFWHILHLCVLHYLNKQMLFFSLIRVNLDTFKGKNSNTILFFFVFPLSFYFFFIELKTIFTFFIICYK